jgi:dTDP-4-amino-4,6-dideoxygalactose transaminase
MTARPTIPFVELRALHESIRSDLDRCWSTVLAASSFVGGSHVERFEEEFAAYCEAEHCIGVGNGTDALELILQALDIGVGDDVVVPANTFVATVEAIVRSGARPVFADVDPDTLLLTAESARRALTRATTAIIAVHLFGRPVDMDALSGLAHEVDVTLIEDAAQAHGGRWNGRRVGSLGCAAAFSFYPTKNLGALGDGGAVVTNDRSLAETVRSLADHGRAHFDRSRHLRLGRNSRLDALQAAVLSVKLRHLDDWNDRRRQVHEWYRDELRAFSVAPATTSDGTAHVHHLQVIRVDDRDSLVDQLDAARIGWGIHYPVPCHQLEPYRKYASGSLEVVERAAAEIVSLPMHPMLAKADVERVCDVVRPAGDR